MCRLTCHLSTGHLSTGLLDRADHPSSWGYLYQLSADSVNSDANVWLPFQPASNARCPSHCRPVKHPLNHPLIRCVPKSDPSTPCQGRPKTNEHIDVDGGSGGGSGGGNGNFAETKLKMKLIMVENRPLGPTVTSNYCKKGSSQNIATTRPPSNHPTIHPSNQPSNHPTIQLEIYPSNHPTIQPSIIQPSNTTQGPWLPR